MQATKKQIINRIVTSSFSYCSIQINIILCYAVNIIKNKPFLAGIMVWDTCRCRCCFARDQRHSCEDKCYDDFPPHGLAFPANLVKLSMFSSNLTVKAPMKSLRVTNFPTPVAVLPNCHSFKILFLTLSFLINDNV